MLDSHCKNLQVEDSQIEIKNQKHISTYLNVTEYKSPKHNLTRQLFLFVTT